MISIYALVCKSTHWSTDDLLVTTEENQHTRAATDLSILWIPSTKWGCWLVWSYEGYVPATQLLWVSSSLPTFSSLSLYQSSGIPSAWCPLHHREGCMKWLPHFCSFSALWPVLWFCISHHLLYKKSSKIRIKSHILLEEKTCIFRG